MATGRILRWVSLEPEQDDKLVAYADKEQRSISNTLKMIITNFFKDEKRD